MKKINPKIKVGLTTYEAKVGFTTYEASKILSVTKDDFNKYLDKYIDKNLDIYPDLAGLRVAPIDSRIFNAQDIIAIDKILPERELITSSLEERIGSAAIFIAAAHQKRSKLIDAVLPLIKKYPDLLQVLKSSQKFPLVIPEDSETEGFIWKD